MAHTIKDGTGKGYEAGVNKNNELKVVSKSRSALARASKYDGQAYVWTAATADLAAADTALLVCNNSQTLKLHITKVTCWADVATQFQIHIPAYPTLAGTAVTGICLNRSKQNTADASAYADETGNTQGSILAVLRNNEVGTDQFLVSYDFEGALILGYHQSVGVDIVADSAAFECTIEGYFEDDDS